MTSALLADLRREIAMCEQHKKTGDACAVYFIGLPQKAGHHTTSAVMSLSRCDADFKK